MLCEMYKIYLWLDQFSLNHSKDKIKQIPNSIKSYLVKQAPCTETQIFQGKYRKTSNISRTLVSNEIVDSSDVVGASPAGAAPTTSSFST